MNYRDNQPTFNVNRKVANFKDFATDKEKLAKADLQRKPNSEDQQHLGNKRTEYNPVTHKLTDYSDDEIKDRLDSIEEFEEANEGIFSDRLQQDNDDFYEPNKSSKMYSEGYDDDDFSDEFDDDLELINDELNIAGNALHIVKSVSEGRDDLNDINQFAADTIQKINDFRKKRNI